jgi:hypothetical protein
MPRAISSACSVAIVLGVISPKRRTNIVKSPVAILTAAFPHNCRVMVVAKEDAEILTRLFPIRMALSILAELDVILRTLCAFLSPDSASVRILI